jgi:hypothetical protein
MSSGTEPEPTEEELRAAFEEEMKRVRVQDLLLQGAVSTINLGFRRSGVAPGTEGERDLEQVRLAIEAVRAHMPLLEQSAPEQLRAIRDALSQLQMAYVRAGGTPPSGQGEEPKQAGEQPPPAAERGEAGAGTAQSSGRLWVPGR